MNMPVQRENFNTFNAAPDGAVYPVVKRFEVTLPCAAWNHVAGARLTFEPCEAICSDNSYLLHSGELVSIQSTGKGMVAVRRPSGSVEVMSRRDASNLVAATRIRDLDQPGTATEDLITALVDIGVIRRIV